MNHVVANPTDHDDVAGFFSAKVSVRSVVRYERASRACFSITAKTTSPASAEILLEGSPSL